MTTPRVVVLVEGLSDQIALHALARRAGRDLADEGIDVLAMGGITNTRTYAARYGPAGLGLRLAGLYDAAEESFVRKGLAAAGLTTALQNGGLTELGFHRCDRDLEDELIRALELDGAESVIEAAGELRSLRLLARMPAQREWTREEVLRRFLGSQAGRKARYAKLFVEAAEPGREPAPLAALLAQL